MRAQTPRDSLRRHGYDGALDCKTAPCNQTSPTWFHLLFDKYVSLLFRPSMNRRTTRLPRNPSSHSGKAEPALIGPDIREISHPHTILVIDRKFPPEMVRSQNRRGPVHMPVPLIAPDSLDLVLYHNPLNSMYAVCLALFIKIKKYPRIAVHAAAGCMQHLDPLKKTFIFCRSL